MSGRRRDTTGVSAAAGLTSPGALVKLYYRIGEVARLVGVAPHVLRYWESEFPTVRPQKSSHGQRVYTKRDVHKLLFIKHLLKDQGLTIAGARKQLRTQPSGAIPSLDELLGERPSAELGAAVEPAMSAAEPGATLAIAPEPAADLPGLSPFGAKSLRQTLLTVRQELTAWLAELL